jgi:hypothetical protein
MDKVALGQIFLQQFIFRLSNIVPPVFHIWQLSGCYGMPQLSYSAGGLGHTQPVQAQKIINLQ